MDLYKQGKCGMNMTRRIQTCVYLKPPDSISAREVDARTKMLY